MSSVSNYQYPSGVSYQTTSGTSSQLSTGTAYQSSSGGGYPQPARGGSYQQPNSGSYQSYPASQQAPNVYQTVQGPDRNQLSGSQQGQYKCILYKKDYPWWVFFFAFFPHEKYFCMTD